MKPRLRYLGCVFVVALLTICSIRGAYAAEPDPDCVAVLTPEAGAVAARHRAGVPGALNRILIRSEPRYGPQGRWILLRLLDALEASPANDPADILGALCAIPNLPTAAPTFRTEFDKPKDI